MSHPTSQSVPRGNGNQSQSRGIDYYRSDVTLSIADDDNDPSHPRNGGLNISEHTPLLQSDPAIPRVHETINDDAGIALPSEQIPSIQMFYQELRILIGYSFPIFAYVFACSLDISPTLIAAHKYLNILSYWHPSYALGIYPRWP